MVYVDGLFVYPFSTGQAQRVGARNGHQWCHLWADSTEELLEFGLSIGMKTEWLQQKPGRIAHFDLIPSRRKRAITAGAIEMSYAEWYRQHLRR